MKMPDRPGGAGGSLIRANLFDAEDTPPFSRTRHGANTIHKRNGDLIVTRDPVPTNAPPWLMVPYSYLSALTQPFETLLHRFGPDSEDRVDQPTGTTASNQVPFVGLVYVGDGWLLETYQINPARTLHLRLRAADALETTIDLGVTIQPFAESVSFVMGVSLCALGWRDAANGYAFAAYYFNVSTGKHVCAVGSTKLRAMVSTVDMPEPEGYEDGWWTPGTIFGPPVLIDLGYSKCYAVGRGHMLALLVPRDPIEYGRESGVTPQFAPRIGYLSPDGAPQLIRSRDFGQTWATEPAQFLAELGVYEAVADLNNEDSGTYDVPARLVPWCSNFYAAPIGGGRIAIAAGGPSESPELQFDLPWVSSIERQTLRFFVSNQAGSGFTAKPWPLDDARNDFPIMVGESAPSTDTIQRPLFGYTNTNAHVMGTMGPGTFFALVEQVTRTMPGLIYGAYPEAQPLLAYVTRDYGSTWSMEQIPSVLVPFAKTYYENKAGWAATPNAINTGEGTIDPDSWLYQSLGICVTAPSDSHGRGGEVAFFTGEMYGPLAVAITSGKKTFESMVRVELERDTIWTPHPLLVTGIPQIIYTGDALSPTRPETIRLGFPEFEDRT